MNMSLVKNKIIFKITGYFPTVLMLFGVIFSLIPIFLTGYYIPSLTDEIQRDENILSNTLYALEIFNDYQDRMLTANYFRIIAQNISSPQKDIDYFINQTSRNLNSAGYQLILNVYDNHTLEIRKYNEFVTLNNLEKMDEIDSFGKSLSEKRNELLKAKNSKQSFLSVLLILATMFQILGLAFINLANIIEKRKLEDTVFKMNDKLDRIIKTPQKRRKMER